MGRVVVVLKGFEKWFIRACFLEERKPWLFPSTRLSQVFPTLPRSVPQPGIYGALASAPLRLSGFRGLPVTFWLFCRSAQPGLPHGLTEAVSFSFPFPIEFITLNRRSHGFLPTGPRVIYPLSQRHCWFAWPAFTLVKPFLPAEGVVMLGCEQPHAERPPPPPDLKLWQVSSTEHVLSVLCIWSTSSALKRLCVTILYRFILVFHREESKTSSHCPITGSPFLYLCLFIQLYLLLISSMYLFTFPLTDLSEIEYFRLLQLWFFNQLILLNSFTSNICVLLQWYYVLYFFIHIKYVALSSLMP